MRCRSASSAASAAPSPTTGSSVQREEFKRLGVEGDWDNYYSTMDYESEAVIADELGKFLMNGGLYKGSKAVLWSVVEKTALAEAEIEYHDHTSDTVHVRFPVRDVEGRQARRRLGGDLDHDALDHPGQPRARLRHRHRLRAGRGRRGGRGQPRQGRREDGAGQGAGRRRRRGGQVHAQGAWPMSRAEDLDGPDRGASAARPGLRVRRAPAARRLRHRRCRHGLRAYRAGPRRRRL